MVILNTSLLALTFAAGLVLASSDDYQRRDDSDELFERDFEAEIFTQEYPHFDERSDTLNELEARSFFGAVLKIGEKIGEKSIKGRVGMAMKAAKTAAKLEHRGKSARKIEQKLKPSKNIAKQVARVAKQANKNNNDNQNKANQNIIIPMIGRFHGSHYRPRGLEDDEELSRRDLDDEEVFGREYDLLDERDDLD